MSKSGYKSLVGGRGRAGFTLIELMMVLVILAVLLMVAAPSFQESIRRNRLQSTMNGVVTMLAFARAEAVTRGAPVSICASSDATTCTGSNWEQGWLVFLDDGTGAGGVSRDGLRSADELLLRIGEEAPQDVTLRTRNFPQLSRVTFQASGRLDQNVDGTFVICDSRGPDHARALVLNVSGQARFASPDPNDPSGELLDDDGNAINSCP